MRLDRAKRIVRKAKAQTELQRRSGVAHLTTICNWMSGRWKSARIEALCVELAEEIKANGWPLPERAEKEAA